MNCNHLILTIYILQPINIEYIIKYGILFQLVNISYQNSKLYLGVHKSNKGKLLYQITDRWSCRHFSYLWNYKIRHTYHLRNFEGLETPAQEPGNNVHPNSLLYYRAYRWYWNFVCCFEILETVPIH